MGVTILEIMRVYVDSFPLSVGETLFLGICIIFLGPSILQELNCLKKDDNKSLFPKNLWFILGEEENFYEIRLEKNKSYPLEFLRMRLSLLKSRKDSISLFAICITLLVYIFTVPYNEHIFELFFILYSFRLNL